MSNSGLNGFLRTALRPVRPIPTPSLPISTPQATPATPDDVRSTEFLKHLRREEVVVIEKKPYRFDLILKSSGIPFYHLRAEDVTSAALHHALIVFVDCKRFLKPTTSPHLVEFAAEGGLLLISESPVKDSLSSFVNFRHQYGVLSHIGPSFFERSPNIQKRLLAEVLCEQQHRTKHLTVNPAKITKMLAAEGEPHYYIDSDWSPISKHFIKESYSLLFRYLMPASSRPVILGSDRKTEKGSEADEQIATDPYLFPHHAEIRREGSDYYIKALDGPVVIHDDGDINILLYSGQEAYLPREARVALTDRIRFIFDPQG